MVERKVYVLESRNKRDMRAMWCPESADAGWKSRKRIYELRRSYRENNPNHTWRVVVYKPAKSTR